MMERCQKTAITKEGAHHAPRDITAEGVHHAPKEGGAMMNRYSPAISPGVNKSDEVFALRMLIEVFGLWDPPVPGQLPQV
jgi:hypothetical protein